MNPLDIPRVLDARRAVGSGATAHATRVIKLGGRTQGDPALADAIAQAWAAHPGTLCLVHGGGDEISRLQRALGGSPTFIGGRRVTTPADLDTLRMALSGAANKRLVAALVARGVPAIGLSGEDAGLLVATRAEGPLGEVGEPRSVNVALLRHLLDGGFLPVISPVSGNADAEGALNVNGDDAAAAIAAALGAAELLLVADVAGVLVAGEPVAQLSVSCVEQLVADGSITGGMIAKLEAATSALRAGVTRVRVGDHRAIADGTCGTTVAATATLTEVPPALLRGALPLHA